MSFLQNASGTDASGASFVAVARDQFNISGGQTNIFAGTPEGPAVPGVHALLAPVDDALYNRSGSKGPAVKCFENTRKDVIAEIVRWVKRDNSRICWLNGSAGSGKSTISQTIAERYAAKQRLIAKFFFLRAAGNRSKIIRFIPTLAYQLALSVPSTRPSIENAVRDSKLPVVTEWPLEQQFQTLIVKPFLEAKKHPLLSFRTKPMVIIVDGLDECDDKNEIADFIQILIRVFSENPRLPMRVIVTSRVEKHITKILDTSVARSMSHHLVLETFDARRDIRTFFESQFSTICEQKKRVMQNVPRPWPSESDLDALVEKCAGSFIFATTIIKFIDDGYESPHHKIQSALSLDGGLDPLYTQVLSDAPHDHHFGRVIGTIMLLTTPLSLISLARLLRLDTEKIHATLVGVPSILIIPGNDDDPVRPFHTSLRDFLTLRPSEFFVNPPIRHLYILTDCLTAIGVQPVDGFFYCEVEQEYACFNWCHHLHQGLIEDGINSFDSMTHLMSGIVEFASKSMDFWVNTVIWKGDMSGLLVLLSKLNQVSNCPENLKKILEDIGEHAKTKWDDFQKKHSKKLFHHQGQRQDELEYRKRVIQRWVCGRYQ